ncbi:hypothetical protein B0I35DRAFT_481582 [Stachybotrys elegans]|uniref:Adenylate cyclase n=1 Tax=Stachybotrys elegans TaxID=80388 RepID=A0A8K0SLN9_9HYPO|nr:hypothetical protein B0I35DRAFT_481582 [Stachybotrys elegans]
MDDSQRRSSTAIPRLSRLPVSRPASALPKPTSALPRPTSLRPSPSKEALNRTPATTKPTTPTTSAPRLRNSTSYSQLRPGSAASQDGRSSRLRASASREQLSGSYVRSSSVKPKSQPPVAMPTGLRAAPSPRRRPSLASLPQSQPESPEEPSNDDSQSPDADQHIFKRRLTLTRRPSESFTLPPFQEFGYGLATELGTDARPPSSSTENSTGAYDTIRARPGNSRPSLSERTIETLSQLPSSPALKSKSSTHFDPPRKARSNSRPGSSYASDSSRLSSRPGSRDGGMAESLESRFSTMRASTNSFMTPLSETGHTPRRIASTNTRNQVPRASNSRPSLISPSRSVMSPPLQERSESPAGMEKSYGSLSRSASQTAGPLKSRKSINGMFKKPSLPTLDHAAINADSRGHASLNSAKSSNASWDGSIPSNDSATSATTLDSAEPGTPTSRKTSAALREQIAKAKAAKRAAARQPSIVPSPEEMEAPIIPSDDGFDFGMAYSDPFNLNKGQDPKKKVMNQRVSAARTSGRLNIAALGLKEIPIEVMKMYDLESLGTGDGSWAESVDLTRLVAADNELENLDDFMFPDSSPESFAEEDDSQGSIFAGLETLDMHNNLLVTVPLGFRRLAHITSLNLSSNRLSNNSLDTIAQMTSLRDLKLAKNLLYGPLSESMANLTSLEILDIHGNNVSAMPSKASSMARLRILNLSENSFESLDFEELAQLPLTELQARKNKLSGTLIESGIDSLPNLQTLDVSSNQLTRLVPLGGSISLPMVHALSLSMNRLQGLPDMTTWSSLLTLTVDENCISGIPNSFTSLTKLRHADFSANDIRVVPPEIARMDNLSMIRLSGNPLRDKKFVSITTDELKEALSSRLEPPPPYQDGGRQTTNAGSMGANAISIDEAGRPSTTSGNVTGSAGVDDFDSRSEEEDDFATPPTSAPHSPRGRSRTASSLRSRSRTLSNQVWPLKPGGLLDRSRTESSSLHPVVCSRVAADYQVKQVHLQHNLFAGFPNSLSFFADTLTTLSLAHNQLVGESYLTEELDLPVLKELNLSSNHVTGLGPLTKYLHAPMLDKLDVSLNRINALPADLREAFPELSVLIAASNHLIELEPDTIKGLRIVDASSNDITHLNPRIGLLGGRGGLERLDVMGNRFRVPRYNVLERGTEATLRWLRGRVPVADMGAWKKENSEDSAEDA